MPTNELLTVRDELSEYWHRHARTWMQLPHFGFRDEDSYLAFCVAKDWLQDTGEALSVHRRCGFSADPSLAYFEFWGILQAVFVQQDALAELHYAVTGERKFHDTALGASWKALRDFRNLATGHPTRKDRGTGGLVHRSVTGREPKTYDRISIMIQVDGNRSHEVINLGQMLDHYDSEAALVLRYLLRMISKLV